MNTFAERHGLGNYKIFYKKFKIRNLIQSQILNMLTLYYLGLRGTR